jgi:hypothetical protein
MNLPQIGLLFVLAPKIRWKKESFEFPIVFFLSFEVLIKMNSIIHFIGQYRMSHDHDEKQSVDN